MRFRKPKTIEPDAEDRAVIERQYGRLTMDATDEQLAHRYRLAQAAKLIRLYRKTEVRHVRRNG